MNGEDECLDGLWYETDSESVIHKDSFQWRDFIKKIVLYI